MIPVRLNLAGYFLDARVAEGRGDRVAVRTAPQLFSYADVAQRSSRTAQLLASDDIRAEERVIVALPDGIDFVAALFGILRRGSVVVMINPDTTPELLHYFFDYSRATAAFVPADRLQVFEAQTAGLARPPRLYAVGSPECSARLDAQAGEFQPLDTHRDDPAIWLFSGGTTGHPKGVVQTHRSFVNTTLLYGHGVLGVRPGDVTMAVPKLFFGYATGANLFFPFSVGASCALFPERCTPDALFAQVARHRPTILINVPTMIQQMVAHPSAAAADLSSLRLATSAGEPLPSELHDRWMRAFGVELLDGLGTAEMWHIFISNRPGEVVPGTLGRVVPGFDVKLCGDDGGEVAPGELGARWVKGGSGELSAVTSRGQGGRCGRSDRGVRPRRRARVHRRAFGLARACRRTAGVRSIASRSLQIAARHRLRRHAAPDTSRQSRSRRIGAKADSRRGACLAIDVLGYNRASSCGVGTVAT